MKKNVFIDDVILFDGVSEDYHVSRKAINDVYCFLFSKGVFKKAIKTYSQKKTPSKMWFTINRKYLQKWENEVKKHFAAKPEYEEGINYLFLEKPKVSCIHCGAVSYISYMKTYRDYGTGCIGSEPNCCYCYSFSDEAVVRISEIRRKFGGNFVQVYKHLYASRPYHWFSKLKEKVKPKKLNNDPEAEEFEC